MRTEHQSVGSRIKQWLEQRLGPDFVQLVAVCGILSCINGNAQLVIQDGLGDIGQVLRFGLFFMSGGQAVYLMMSGGGGLLHRVQRYLLAYLIVSIGLFCNALFRPALAAMLIEEVRLFVGIYLMGIAVRGWSNGGFLGRIASLDSVKYVLNFVMLAMAFKGAVLAYRGELPLGIEVDPSVLLGLGSSLLCGMGLSFIGLLIGLMVDDESVLRPARLGACGSMGITAAVSYLSLDLPILVMQGRMITLPPLVATLLPITLGIFSTLYLAICAWAKARRPESTGEAHLHVVKPATSKLENRNG